MKPLISEIDPADVIRAAAGSTLGVLSLLVLAVAALAYVFFKKSREAVRVGIFMVLLASAIAFGIALLRSASAANAPEKPPPKEQTRAEGAPPGTAQLGNSVAPPNLRADKPIQQADRGAPKPADARPAEDNNGIQTGSGAAHAAAPTEPAVSAPSSRRVQFDVVINSGWCWNVNGDPRPPSCEPFLSTIKLRTDIDGVDVGRAAIVDSSLHHVTIWIDDDPSQNVKGVGSCRFTIGPNNKLSNIKVRAQIRNTVTHTDLIEYTMDWCRVNQD